MSTICALTFNALIQWGIVIAILIIVAITIVRKIINFQRSMKDDSNMECGCGCSSCSAKCDLKEKNDKTTCCQNNENKSNRN